MLLLPEAPAEAQERQTNRRTCPQLAGDQDSQGQGPFVRLLQPRQLRPPELAPRGLSGSAKWLGPRAEEAAPAALWSPHLPMRSTKAGHCTLPVRQRRFYLPWCLSIFKPTIW